MFTERCRNTYARPTPLVFSHRHYHKYSSALWMSGGCGSGSWSTSQVLGTEVPSFRHFPFQAQEILQLYKSFLRLIYTHHSRKEEQRELLFRLRQEFSGKRHLKGPKAIAAAVRRGQGILEYHTQLLDSQSYTQWRPNQPRQSEKWCLHKRKSDVNESGAQSVDSVWYELQRLTGNTLPGLQHYHCSLDLRESASVSQSTSHVTSRRE